MRCQLCQHLESRVLDSRPADDGASTRRRRECLGCGHRFTTYEKAEAVVPVVIKKDGRREPFDRTKVLRGAVTACRKRPVSRARLEQLVDEVERRLSSAYDREVHARVIGDMVMDGLREVDEVAYVRFASVYMDFEDLHRFRDELDKLLGTGRTDNGEGER